jgi:tetratricopeptide (TPR) repeat protein
VEAVWPGRAHLQFALAAGNLGRPEAAEDALREGQRQAPSYEAAVLLAEREIETGRHSAAVTRLARLERCDPTWRISAEIRYLRGLAAIRRGHHARARSLLVELVDGMPSHVRGHLGLGYLAATEGDDEAARSHYRDAIAAVQQGLAEPSPQQDVARLQDLLRVARRALASVGGDDPDTPAP